MKSKSGALVLTSEYFKIVLDKVHNRFIEKHGLSKLPKTFQLYGYGAFEENRPNLKNDLEVIGNEFINGKYLIMFFESIFNNIENINIFSTLYTW